MEEKAESKIDVRIFDVLRAYWQAVKPQKAHMIYGLLAFAFTQALFLTVPLIYKEFFDLLTNTAVNDRASVAPELMKLILMVLGVYLVAQIFLRTSIISINNLESKTMARLKQMSFDYMVKHSYNFFANNFSGALVQRVNRFSRSFERLFDTFAFDIVPLVVNTVGVMIVIYFFEPTITYIIAVWIIFILIVNFFFSKWKLQYDLASAKADSTTTALLADNLTNQNAISLFATFEQESEKFKETSNDQANKQRFVWNLNQVADTIQGLMIILVEFFIFYYAIKFWQKDLITLGMIVLFQAYVMKIANQLWGFGRIVRNLYEGFADSKEMVVILKTPHEIADQAEAKELSVSKGEIVFENVNFAFNENKNVINNFNLKIESGEKVALIGPSGAGKSTTVKLLLRNIDVSSGSIKIDGQDLREVTQESLHRNIGFVPQEPVLFHRSLLENIRYGRPEATEAEVLEAARLAHCDEFIDKLPLKYETMVGERGIKLSGGERQRVAIARAILKNAPILILDEATSSLDSHSESLIQDALEKLMAGKTSIVIAHRLSTIRKMDRIIVVEKGCVSEDGTHEELLKNANSLYKKLWELQAGGFIAE